MTWSIAGVVESAVKAVLRPLEDAGKILFDAANYVADWEADLLAAEEAERDAWEENELRDRAAHLTWLPDPPLVPRPSDASVDPVECASDPSTPGEEGPEVVAASQRTTSGQQDAMSLLLEPSGPHFGSTGLLGFPGVLSEDAVRRIVNEEVSSLLSSVVSDEVTAESAEPVPSAGSARLSVYPTDLYDAADVLGLALARGDVKPTEYWQPLIDRLKKASAEI